MGFGPGGRGKQNIGDRDGDGKGGGKRGGGGGKRKTGGAGGGAYRTVRVSGVAEVSTSAPFSPSMTVLEMK